MRLGLGLAAVVLVCVSNVGRADDPATAEARRLFQSGTKHFDLAEYEEALSDFKGGYRSKDDPVFLYNIAQCYRLMRGHEDEAIKFYRNYLRRSPEAPNRKDVEKKIETLEQALSVQEQARSAPPSNMLRPGESTGGESGHTPPAAVENGAATPAVVTPPPTEDRPDRPVYKKWWLWTIVGAVVLVGAGVGVGVGLSQSSSGTPTFPLVMF